MARLELHSLISSLLTGTPTSAMQSRGILGIQFTILMITSVVYVISGTQEMKGVLILILTLIQRPMMVMI